MKTNKLNLARFVSLEYNFKPYCSDYDNTIKHNRLMAKDFNSGKRLGKIILNDADVIKESVVITAENGIKYIPDFKYFKGGSLKWLPL